MLLRRFPASRIPVETLPSEQGLKLISIGIAKQGGFRPVETLPSEQGLKRHRHIIFRLNGKPGRNTSIRTRIETFSAPAGREGVIYRSKHFHQNKD